MTALDKYLRLEATGYWRPDPQADAREVLVCFGDATLTFSTFDETPKAHWALAALRRISGDSHQAVYSPDAEGFETLLLEDEQMIAAISEVCKTRSIVSERPIGRWLVVGVLGIILVAATIFVPSLLRSQAVRMTSQDSARRMGWKMLEAAGFDICRSSQGDRARATFERAVFPDGKYTTLISRAAKRPTIFPGGILVMPEIQLQNAPNSDTFAADFMRLANAEPGVKSIFYDSSLSQVIQYIMSGDLPVDRIREVVDDRVNENLPTPASPTPHIDSTPLLREPVWVALQSICLN